VSARGSCSPRGVLFTVKCPDAKQWKQIQSVNSWKYSQVGSYLTEKKLRLSRYSQMECSEKTHSGDTDKQEKTVKIQIQYTKEKRKAMKTANKDKVYQGKLQWFSRYVVLFWLIKFSLSFSSSYLKKSRHFAKFQTSWIWLVRNLGHNRRELEIATIMAFCSKWFSIPHERIPNTVRWMSLLKQNKDSLYHCSWSWQPSV